MKKKLLPVILVCCMLSAWLAAYAHADDVVASGDCGADGSNVRWSLDSGGTLTISGRGVMANLVGQGLWGNGSPMSVNMPWYDSRNMITSLTVGEGITSISPYAFYGLNRLTRATLPDSISSIENGVFYGCSNLLNFNISGNVSSIGDYAFCGCDRLTAMTIPRNVINIGANAFNGCDVLQSVTILADTPIINASTFANCAALREITIPNGVVIIGENAFSGCSALRDVYFIGAENLWNNVTINSGNQPLQNATIHFDTSIEATSYRINSITVSDGAGNPLTEIPNGTFWETLSITNRASGGTPIIFFAAYAANGQFLDCAYVTVKEPVGGTVEVTLPVDNSSGNITQLKAFAVRSFDGLEPIGNLVSFPAQ